MTRSEALQIVDKLVRTQNIRKHLLAAEAAMVGLYRYCGANGRNPELNEEAWGIVGLLHDADYEATDKELERHTDLVVAELEGTDAPREVVEAIKGHCDKAPRDTLIAKAIYAADELTGLIVAAALVHPQKQLAPLSVDTIMKRFREGAFARGANREQIKSCESELGIPLEEFTGIVLEAMKDISGDLGL